MGYKFFRYITLDSGGDLRLDVPTGTKDFDVYWAGVLGFTLDHSANNTYLAGGSITGDDLIIYANKLDAQPLIQLYGNTHIKLDAPQNIYIDHGSSHQLVYAEEGTTYSTFYRDGNGVRMNASIANEDISF